MLPSWIRSGSKSWIPKYMGDSLVLTLNTQLQQVCYDALGDNKGAIVVLEPSTGKVLAMVSNRI